MKVVYSPVHLAHDIRDESVMGEVMAAHEVAERAERIRTTLAADPTFEFVDPTEHGMGPIAAVHDEGLIRFLGEAWSQVRREGIPRTHLVPEGWNGRGVMEGFAPDSPHRSREPGTIAGRAGHWALDASTPIVAGTYMAALAAVDVALTATDLVLEAGAPIAYGLCRPPGHHAARSMYGGYCFLNNAAIAAQSIVARTGEAMAILDLDFHHGNGTEQIFWRRGDVVYVSIHGDPDRRYPYFLGYADEVGEGPGAGANLNLPLGPGIDDDAYLVALERALERVAATPGSIVVVSLGFDTYAHDPLGDFSLSTEGYHEIGRRVAALGRRLVVVQEGGYHRPSLGHNARSWLRGAAGWPFEPLPVTGFAAGGSVV